MSWSWSSNLNPFWGKRFLGWKYQKTNQALNDCLLLRAPRNFIAKKVVSFCASWSRPSVPYRWEWRGAFAEKNSPKICVSNPIHWRNSLKCWWMGFWNSSQWIQGIVFFSKKMMNKSVFWKLVLFLDINESIKPKRYRICPKSLLALC